MSAGVMQGFHLALTVFLGLCFGSFATALAYRLPRGISMVKRVRSACPSCGHPLGVPDLVPVFSWLFLRGRCRHCRAPIGWRYPLIELATLFLCLVFLHRFGFSPPLLAVFVLAPLVVSIMDIDIHHKIIPDALNISIAGAGAAALLLTALDAAD
ncbi:MAG: prepilin peptidase, partial [Alphaproteobacteria bacterium]|nr:prepilin peptidase [Alphaproteobacteria bacterium]